jgi:hypothetical protein
LGKGLGDATGTYAEYAVKNAKSPASVKEAQ